jgi:hypothetical protein
VSSLETEAKTLAPAINEVKDYQGTLDDKIVALKTLPYGTASEGENGVITGVTGTLTLSLGWPAGSTRFFYNESTSEGTISPGSGLTLRKAGTTESGTLTLSPYGIVSVWARSATEYLVSGHLE